MNIIFVTVGSLLKFPRWSAHVADISSFKQAGQVHGRYFRQRAESRIEAEAKVEEPAGRSQPQ